MEVLVSVDVSARIAVADNKTKSDVLNASKTDELLQKIAYFVMLTKQFVDLSLQKLGIICKRT